MGKRKFLNTIWLLSIFTLITPLRIHAGTKEKTFPIPRAAVEETVISWLQGSGYSLQGTHFEKGLTDIWAEKEMERWHIVIQPQSALACHVTAAWTGPDNPKNTDPYKSLWNRISNHDQPPNPDNDMNYKAIPKEVRSRFEAVVRIRIVGDDDEKQVSGFFLDAYKGLVISTAHDLMEFQKSIIVLYNGLEINGQVVHLDQRVDLALIQVQFIPKSGILLTESRNLLNLGDRLYAIGYSTDRRSKVTPGIVSGPPRRADSQLLWQVEMKILPGNSGSPVFDEKGRLVAVVKGRHREKESVGFLIPLETVTAFIKANIDYVQFKKQD